jgi:haloalkane dehalogenase
VILALRGSFRCIAPDYPGFGLSRAADGYDFRPASHAKVIEGLVDRLGLEGIVVFGYAWGGPIGLGLAGRRPDLVRALVIGNTWAWPDDRLKVRLFSALMGGPLSRLLVDRLNLMLRVYLPANLKRGRLSERERAAYRGPFPRGSRRQMSAFPREIVTGRGYLREVESNLPKLAGKRALIVWPDSDPGFGDAELHRWQALFPTARTVVLRNAGQFIDEDAPADIAGAITDWWTAEVSPPEVVPRTRAKPTATKTATKAVKPKSTKASKATTPKARAARKPPSRP